MKTNVEREGMMLLAVFTTFISGGHESRLVSLMKYFSTIIY